MELSPGTRLGRYEVLELLAIGGMGQVYVARATGPESFQKLVALKRVLPHLSTEEEFVAMFLEEARLAATLDHPNIVQVIELGNSRHGYFLTMEFLHGVDLRTLLQTAAQTSALPLECALSIASALAAGLHYAHERSGPDGHPMGLVHRDVSPSNVIVTYDGVVKLVDFGVAKAVARTTRTRATVLKGKVGYMSPEQCRGMPVDRRSDLFSLGVLLYELTTLHRPFYEDNHFAALNRIVSGDYERPSTLIEGYRPGLEQIVNRALAPEPDHRYRTAREMLDDLERFTQAEGLRSSSAVLADYVVEQMGRPPFPSYGPIPARPASISSDASLPGDPTVTVVGRLGSASRGQMWLVLGLIATALMSSATLMITLMRQTAPAPAPPKGRVGADNPMVPAPPVVSSDQRATRADPPADPSATQGAQETGEGDGLVIDESDPSLDDSAHKTRNSRKRRGRRSAGSPASTPTKPEFESIFPP